ncbi:MAG: acetylxylan esterase, partial [Verrucomicrobiota bacterium]
SGEGGASMMRRDWGETIDDIGQLSPGNYCANFQKWVGNWEAMPADANMLVALMAPRPLLITGGTDDQWSDPVGVFWSGVSGGKVYKLLGAGNFPADNPPAPNTFVGDGALVHYNHIGGHITTPEESAKYLEMIKKHFKVVPFGTHAR